MSKKSFNYKGYTGGIDFSLEDNVLFGKIEFINDLVSYEGNDLPELETAFREAVDDYLEMCEEIGKAPEKTMSGTFNVRVGEVLHKQLAKYAYKEDKSINDIVKLACEEYCSKRDHDKEIIEQVRTSLSNMSNRNYSFYLDSFVEKRESKPSWAALDELKQQRSNSSEELLEWGYGNSVGLSYDRNRRH